MAENQVGKGTDDSNNDQSCYSYEGNLCIYTDPQTHVQYQWDEEKNDWVLRQSKPSKFSEDDTGQDYVYDGETYTYVDKEGVKYKWNAETSEWTKTTEDDSGKHKTTSDTSSLVDELRSGVYDVKDSKQTYTDPNDGTVYEWDYEKNAWFPKVDEDFIAQYQMSYGFTKEGTVSEKKEDPIESKNEESNTALDDNALKRKGPPPPPTWFEVDEKHNTKVYVSNLPCDINETEFLEIMQKCGLVMKDPDTNRMKIKLYTDPEGRPKGDGLCSYIKVESVELALNLLDGMDVRGRKIHVERAKFQMKGDKYDANLKPRKKRKKDKEKFKRKQEKLFDWRPDKMRGERGGNERVVVVKNLFEAGLFDTNAALLLEYREDLREECSKCGKLKKVVIHDRHPEGVAQVYFDDPEEADICIKLLNGRWFGQRRLTAETWDGKTKYRVEETEEEKEKRLQNWVKFLETGEGGPGGSSSSSTVATEKKMDAEVKESKTECDVEDVHSKSEVAEADDDESSSPVNNNSSTEQHPPESEYGGIQGKKEVPADEADTDSNPEGNSDDED